MADSVLYDGVDDRTTFSIGNLAIPCGPITIATVFKRNSASTWDTIVYSADGATRGWAAYVNDSNYFLLGSGIEENFPQPETCNIGTSTEWFIYVATKASGTVEPRYHRYDGTVWDHNSSSATITNGNTPSSSITVGCESDGDNPAPVNVLIWGVANEAFGDATIENLSLGYQAWKNFGFDDGVRMNATSGLASFVSGSSMTQTGATGTTLDTGDVPSWWDDTLSPTNTTLRTVSSGLRW